MGFSSARLVARPVNSKNWVIVWAAVAIATPTLLRWSLDGIVTGVAATPFIPFVVLSAVFLEWRSAAAVALISAAIGNTLFIGAPDKLFEGPTDIVSAAAFLIASAAIISFVEAVRSQLRYRRPAVRSEMPSDIVFSLEAGQVWASWYGRDAPVHLGPQDEVARMMQDFLAQSELGQRLADRNS